MLISLICGFEAQSARRDERGESRSPGERSEDGKGKTRGPRAVQAREPVIAEARSSVHARLTCPHSIGDDA